MLNDVSQRIAVNGYNVSFDKSVVENVVENGFDEKMGARNIKREIQTFVEDNISDAIINDEILPNEKYIMKVKNNIVSFNKLKVTRAEKIG
jgi:ATP-dependent Clp protease ATP-binding subunit ClpC